MIELMLLWILAQGPQCVAEHHEFLRWGDINAGGVETDPVPPGKVWMVRAAGVMTSYPWNGVWMMELKHPVWGQGGVCCFSTVLERTDWRSGTPPVSLTRPMFLYEGDRLTGRMCCMSNNYQIGINMLYYELPQSCLPFVKPN